MVSADEIKYVMKSIGQKLSDEEITYMMQQADCDENGCLNYDGKYSRPGTHLHIGKKPCFIVQHL